MLNDRARDKTQRNRWFFAIVFVALVGLTLFQIRTLVAQRTPLHRAEALLPEIGGIRVDKPLPEALSRYTLERSTQPASEIRLEAHAGKTLFLHFWATWCEPCIREIPSLLAAADEMNGTDLEMIAVSYDDGWQPIRDFFGKFAGGIPGTIRCYRDPNAASDASMRMALGAEKVPETFIIRNGVVLHKFIGSHDWTEPGKRRYLRLMAEGGKD